jgi:hypothetical protein
MVDVEHLTPAEQLDLIGELWDRLSRAPDDIPCRRPSARRSTVGRTISTQILAQVVPSAFPGKRSFARYGPAVLETVAVPPGGGS